MLVIQVYCAVGGACKGDRSANEGTLVILMDCNQYNIEFGHGDMYGINLYSNVVLQWREQTKTSSITEVSSTKYQGGIDQHRTNKKKQQTT